MSSWFMKSFYCLISFSLLPTEVMVLEACDRSFVLTPWGDHLGMSGILLLGQSLEKTYCPNIVIRLLAVVHSL